MAKFKTDFQEKLQKLEAEKQILIAKRKEEILTIIEKIGCLTIDNELLVGSLLLAKDASTINQKLGASVATKANNENPTSKEKTKELKNIIEERASKFFRKKSTDTESAA